jgi:hypothetical protein
MDWNKLRLATWDISDARPVTFQVVLIDQNFNTHTISGSDVEATVLEDGTIVVQVRVNNDQD